MTACSVVHGYRDKRAHHYPADRPAGGYLAAAADQPLAVAVGEKLKSVSVRVAGKKSSFGRHGKMIHVRIGGGAHQKIKVKITEVIKVGKRKEKFNFSYVYKRC